MADSDINALCLWDRWCGKLAAASYKIWEIWHLILWLQLQITSNKKEMIHCEVMCDLFIGLLTIYLNERLLFEWRMKYIGQWDAYPSHCTMIPSKSDSFLFVAYNPVNCFFLPPNAQLSQLSQQEQTYNETLY